MQAFTYASPTELKLAEDLLGTGLLHKSLHEDTEERETIIADADWKHVL